MKALITGGAGYIGSTVASAFLDAGLQSVCIDSLTHGRREFVAEDHLYIGDIADNELIDQIFQEHPDISVLIHCAALIDVEESTRRPEIYYMENLCKAIMLLQKVLEKGVRRVIFSSTAAVYDGGDGSRGLTEEATLSPLNPYAHSKLMFEKILADICIQANASAVILRYFNPVGADPLYRSGPYKPDPSHILGKLTKLVGTGGGEFVINGNDYPTRDGTPVRDYIHVWDLAQAHVAAVNFVEMTSEPGCTVINVGSGTGVTVREFVDAFLAVTRLPLAVRVGSRRPGDTAGAYADTSLAHALLHWRPRLSLTQGIQDALTWEVRWQSGKGARQQ